MPKGAYGQTAPHTCHVAAPHGGEPHLLPSCIRQSLCSPLNAIFQPAAERWPWWVRADRRDRWAAEGRAPGIRRAVGWPRARLYKGGARARAVPGRQWEVRLACSPRPPRPWAWLLGSKRAKLLHLPRPLGLRGLFLRAGTSPSSTRPTQPRTPALALPAPPHAQEARGATGGPAPALSGPLIPCQAAAPLPVRDTLKVSISLRSFGSHGRNWSVV